MLTELDPRSLVCTLVDSDPIDIIVPVYNSPDWVRYCLESISLNTHLPYRLIVVDDCSDNYTQDVLSELVARHRRSTVVRNQRNLGFVKSCNAGIAASNSKYVVLMNSDVIVPPKWLNRLLACMESDSRIGIANPLSNEAANLSIPLAPGCNYGGMAEGLPKFRLPAYPDIVTAVGFCIMLRTQMLNETGLFDEVYDQGYCEETDLCIRAMKNGWRVVACDDLYVYHRGAGSFTDRDERYRKNLRIFLQRHGAFYQKAYGEFLKNSPLKDIFDGVNEPQPTLWGRWLSIGRTVITDLSGAHPLRAWRHLKEGRATTKFHRNARRYKPFWQAEKPSVTFLFDSLDSYGGVLSVFRLVNGLIGRGFEVRIASLYGDRAPISGLFTQPMHFGNRDRLLDGVAESDVFISTIWTTAYWIPALRLRFPKARFISYIQDYESWFNLRSADASESVIKSYDFPDLIVTTSSWLYSKLQEHGKYSVIIPKGVDGDVFRNLENGARAVKSVLAMARPHTPYRGFQNIVKIFPELSRQDPEIALSLFGCEDKKLPSFDFPVQNCGVIENGSKLAKLYNGHSVFLDASSFQGFGMMGLEAMGCGCACVLTCVGGINEYAKDKVNSLLISPDDLPLATNSIRQLLTDEKLRNRLVAEGSKTAKEFSIQKEIDSFAECLKLELETSVCNGSGRSATATKTE